jgi:hypothetical protein
LKETNKPLSLDLGAEAKFRVAERGEVQEVIPGSYGLEVGLIEWKEKRKS